MSYPSQFRFQTSSPDDTTRPSLTAWGTVITPAQDAYGAAYANLGVLSATHATYEWDLGIGTTAIAGNSRVAMVKIGIDLAGGTSFTDVIVDLPVGSSEGSGNGRLTMFRFKYLIPAGASVGVKMGVHSATLTGSRVFIARALGNPEDPASELVGSYSDSFGGTIVNCQGVTVVPGTTSDGDWVLIGTLSRTLWWWEYGLALDDATVIANNQLHVDIAVGDAASTTTTGDKRDIIKNHSTFYNTNESSWRPEPAGFYARAVAGEKIYARVHCSNAIEDGTYSIGVVGIGGDELADSPSGYPRSRIVNS